MKDGLKVRMANADEANMSTPSLVLILLRNIRRLSQNELTNLPNGVFDKLMSLQYL